MRTTTWIDFRALREQLDLADVLEHYGVEIQRRNGDQITCLCPLPDHPVRREGKRTASFSGNIRKGCWQCFGCGQSGSCLDLAVLLEGKDLDDRDAVREIALQLAETFDLHFDRPPPERRQRRQGGGYERDRHRTRARRGNRPHDDHDSIPTKKAMDAATPITSGDRTVGGTDRRTLNARHDTPAYPTREAEISSDMGDADGIATLPPGITSILINPPLDFTLQHLDPTHPYLTQRGLAAETVGHFGLGSV